MLVAVWYVVFSLPLFLWVPEDRSRVSRAGHVVADTFAQLGRTFGEIRKYRQIVRFLFARLMHRKIMTGSFRRVLADPEGDFILPGHH